LGVGETGLGVAEGGTGVGAGVVGVRVGVDVGGAGVRVSVGSPVNVAVACVGADVGVPGAGDPQPESMIISNNKDLVISTSPSCHALIRCAPRLTLAMSSVNATVPSWQVLFYDSWLDAYGRMPPGGRTPKIAADA
jgi:hypothetical protein